MYVIWFPGNIHVKTDIILAYENIYLRVTAVAKYIVPLSPFIGHPLKLKCPVNSAVCSSVHSLLKIFEVQELISFSLIFCMKLEVTTSDFWKKSLVGSGGPKMVKNWGFWGFSKNLIHSNVLFLLEYESSNGLLLSAKIKCLGKI